MNKNQKTYLLLCLVVIVWGSIGYQVYKNYNPSLPEISKTSSLPDVPKQHIASSSYEILVEYRDPFTGKLFKKPVKKIKKTTSKSPVIFPKIQFKGMIDGVKKSYIISINGHQEIFQLNQTYQQITLREASKKNITVVYKNKPKKYTLEE